MEIIFDNKLDYYYYKSYSRKRNSLSKYLCSLFSKKNLGNLTKYVSRVKDTFWLQIQIDFFQVFFLSNINLVSCRISNYR
jgi:hypothetical protein